MWFAVGLWLGLGFLWGQENQQRKLEREAKFEMARWEGTD